MIGERPNGYRFEYRRTRSGQWRVRFVAPNGRILWSTEAYKTLQGCDGAVRATFEAVRGERPDVWMPARCGPGMTRRFVRLSHG